MTDSPYNERDEETQRFTATYSDEDFLTAITEIENDGELASTADVADAVGCSKRSALYRLDELADAGRVSKQSAGTSAVWTVDE